MKLTAQSLLYILSALLLLVFAGTVGGFYLAQSNLHDYAESITQLNANAEAGDKDIATLQRLKDRLASSQEVIKRTESIVSESKQYIYQNQIIEDITAIARRSGVTVTAFEFAGSSADAAGANPPAAPVATPGAPAAPDSGTAPSAASSVKSVVTNVTIKNPVSYKALINFIQDIEANRMKMQISKVSLSADDKGGVTSQSFAIEVYTR